MKSKRKNPSKDSFENIFKKFSKNRGQNTLADCYSSRSQKICEFICENVDIYTPLIAH